jgi:hypothetical protein
MRKNNAALRLSPIWASPAAALLMCALLGAGVASAQGSADWAVEEKASQGCVQEVWLQFEGAAGLASHAPRSLCGSTGVREYPDSLPSGTIALGWKDRNGEGHHYQVPLDAILRKENVRMSGTVLEFDFGQNTLEVWARPLASTGGLPADGTGSTDAAAGRQRLFFAGVDVSPGKPLKPGIHRERE